MSNKYFSHKVMAQIVAFLTLVVVVIVPTVARANDDTIKITLQKIASAVNLPSHFVIDGRVKINRALLARRNVKILGNLNIFGKVFNDGGKFRIDDVLRVDSFAIFRKDLNVHGVIKNRKDDDPVVIDDDLVVTGNVSFEGLDAEEVASVRGITSVDTSALQPGDLVFDDNTNILYVWTGEKFIDLTIDTNTTYTAGAGLKLDNTTFSIATGGVTNDMLASSIAYSKLNLANSILSNDLATNSVGAAALSADALQPGDIGTDDLPGSVTLDNANETISGNWNFTGSVDFKNITINGQSFTTTGTTALTAGDGISISNNTVSVKQGGVINSMLAGEIAYDKLTLASSIKGSDLVDGTVTSTDIADGAVSSGDVADNTLIGSDLADNAVGSGELANTAIQVGDIGTDDLPSSVPLDNVAETITGDWHFTGDVQIDGLNVSLPDNVAFKDKNESITGTWTFSKTTDIFQLLINKYAPAFERNLRVPTPFSRKSFDTSNSSGSYTALTIGRDGFPVIAYYDGSSKDLIFLRCTSLDCATTDSRRTLDSTDTSGLYASMAISTDGYPIIAYQKVDASNNGTLRVVHCTSVDCSTVDAARTIDSGGSGIVTGSYTSIMIGSDGYAVISYMNSTEGKLKVVHCTNTSCSTNSSIVTLESSAGIQNSLAIAVDGYPIISYYNHGNGDLKTLHCTSYDCSSFETAVTLDSSGEVGMHTSITIGTDGYPIISYYDNTNGDLKVAHCTSYNCATFETPVKVDTSGTVGWFTSITIGKDGFPYISYFDSTNEDLKAVHCTNQSCSKFTTSRALDSSSKVGQYTSMAIGVDGLPVIAYYDSTNIDLKVYKASNPYLLDYWTRR